jgi:hypothetical protein
MSKTYNLKYELLKKEKNIPVQSYKIGNINLGLGLIHNVLIKKNITIRNTYRIIRKIPGSKI